MTSINFEYSIPVARKITHTELRKVLGEVRDQLLTHRINGGGRKLRMDIVCQSHSCGTAACIGGWTALLLLGFEGKTPEQRDIVALLFENLISLDSAHSGSGRLSALFHHFANTDDYNEPNVAATAIQRYLDRKFPWPTGTMPDVLPYKRTRTKRK
jgi:hypothetical protein